VTNLQKESIDLTGHTVLAGGHRSRPADFFKGGDMQASMSDMAFYLFDGIYIDEFNEEDISETDCITGFV
jgi:hypothetical protein